MNWGKRTFGGKLYDLTHLNPFTMPVPCGGMVPFRVRVAFGCHVFAREWKLGDPDDHKIMDGGTPRYFCPDRFGHSAALPDMVRAAAHGNAYFSTKRRLVLLERAPVVGRPYMIAFKIAEPRKKKYYDAIMDVVSAHERDFMPTLKPIKFQKLVGLIATGQKLAWP